jgi:hypothetical protein
MDGENCRKHYAATTPPMHDGPITDCARQRSSLYVQAQRAQTGSIPTVKTRTSESTIFAALDESNEAKFPGNYAAASFVGCVALAAPRLRAPKR